MFVVRIRGCHRRVSPGTEKTGSNNNFEGVRIKSVCLQSGVRLKVFRKITPMTSPGSYSLLTSRTKLTGLDWLHHNQQFRSHFATL